MSFADLFQGGVLVVKTERNIDFNGIVKRVVVCYCFLQQLQQTDVQIYESYDILPLFGKQNCQGKLNFNFGPINCVKFTVSISTLSRTKYMYSKPWRQENLSKLSERQLSGLLFHNVVIALFELQSSYSAYM